MSNWKFYLKYVLNNIEILQIMPAEYFQLEIAVYSLRVRVARVDR